MKFPHIYIEKLKRPTHSNMSIQPIYAELKYEVVVSAFMNIV